MNTLLNWCTWCEENTREAKCRHCGTVTESSIKKIVVTKHGLVVDGREVQTRNRWEAKTEAARLAKERGCSWFTLKSNGKLVEVKP